MRRILICVLAILISPAALISAQDDNNALNHLSDLSRRGELQQLIQAANSLLANEKLSPAGQGIVLMYLGHAYQQCCGDFIRATAYYEKALAVIDRDGSHSNEYAAILGALATVYVETGQTSTAKHVLLGSLRLFEKQGNHAMATMIWNDLATMAADERSAKDAHKYMQHAVAESQLAENLNQDQTSALAATQASIAELDNDPTAAISDYQHSLALWMQCHDDQHPDTGWFYVLLGGAYLQAGDIAHAREITSHGLQLLEANPGRESPRYFAAELVYAKVLDAAGAHEEASTLRKEAQAALHAEQQRAQGTISIAALR